MNAIIIHAKEANGTLVDVQIAYDLFDIIWDRDLGTLTLKPKPGTTSSQGVGHYPSCFQCGPAIQNHPIAVIRSIREEESPEEGHHRRYMATRHEESESEKLERNLEPRP